jgi:hypothetical protein
MIQQRRVHVNGRDANDFTIRHFWGGEMKGTSADIGTSGAPDLMPIRTILDVTPERRERNWYSKRDD